MRQVVGAAVRRIVAAAAGSAAAATAAAAEGAAAAPIGRPVALLKSRKADVIAVNYLLRADVAQQLLDVLRGLALRQLHGFNLWVRVDTVSPQDDHGSFDSRHMQQLKAKRHRAFRCCPAPARRQSAGQIVDARDCKRRSQSAILEWVGCDAGIRVQGQRESQGHSQGFRCGYHELGDLVTRVVAEPASDLLPSAVADAHCIVVAEVAGRLRSRTSHLAPRALAGMQLREACDHPTPVQTSVCRSGHPKQC